VSFDPVLWAMKDAPVANVEEWAVLVCMAEKADDDGCTSMPSHNTISAFTRISVPTVKRRIGSLEERRLIARGDQRAADRYRADRRPVVWDLMIPYSWFPNLDRIQAYRAERGRPPLTWADRPDLADPPPRRLRSDAGTKRSSRRDSAEGLEDPPHDGSSRAGGLQDPGVFKSDGSGSGATGGLVVPNGGSSRPTTFVLDPPQEPSPSVAAAATTQAALEVDVQQAVDPEAAERLITQALVGAYAEAYRRSGGIPTKAVMDACGRNVKRLRARDRIDPPVLLLAVQRAGAARARDLDRHLGEAQQTFTSGRQSARAAMFRAWDDIAATLSTRMGA